MMNVRAIAEDKLRDLGGCVLNLAGLYGGERDPKNWVMHVATTKEQVKRKLAAFGARGGCGVGDCWGVQEAGGDGGKTVAGDGSAGL